MWSYLARKLLVLCIILSALTVAQTQTATTAPPPKFLYSSDNAGGKIYGYVVNPTSGSLKPTGQNPPWAHWGPTRIASDNGGYRLYVINEGRKTLTLYEQYHGRVAFLVVYITEAHPSDVWQMQNKPTKANLDRSDSSLINWRQRWPRYQQREFSEK